VRGWARLGRRLVGLTDLTVRVRGGVWDGGEEDGAPGREMAHGVKEGGGGGARSAWWRKEARGRGRLRRIVEWLGEGGMCEAEGEMEKVAKVAAGCEIGSQRDRLAVATGHGVGRSGEEAAAV